MSRRFTRRRFIESAGGAVAAGVLAAVPDAAVGGVTGAGILPRAAAGTESDPARSSASPTPRVAVLWEPEFPHADAAPPDRAQLEAALSGMEATFLDVRALATHLRSRELDVLVLPYGSAFPKQLWTALIGYLRDGGNLVNLGGVPAAIPVRRDGGRWRAEVRQTAYHKRLGITQAFPVTAEGVQRWQPNPEHPWTAALAGVHANGITREMYVRLTDAKEFPDEDGSAGPRQAVLTPLLSGLRADGLARVVPVVQLDRIAGEFAGGRWILGTAETAYPPPAVRAMVVAAAAGATQLLVRPSLACYHAGEAPEIAVALERPGKRADDPERAQCRLEVFDPGGARVAGATVPLTGGRGRAEGRFTPPEQATRAPGLYRVEAALVDGSGAPVQRASTGFWRHDSALLASGERLAANDFMLTRGGRPFPVTGTTYMASDVHRAFLLEPNPLVWDRDFARMRDAGVNMVRTGIWTGWSRLASADGTPTEPVLRAAEAFFLTARRHDVPLIFTFFAFLPVAWGGQNPYLDPRAVEAQKRFVTAFAARASSVPDVVWDLINEPSFSSAAQLWYARPNYDAFEEAAWQEWLARRYPAASAEERAERLQELWRTTPEDALKLPALEDFVERDIFTGARPLKALEYRLFAQDAFARWARDLATALRAGSRVPRLVTVGQDEGGTEERPANQFLARELDLTSIHNWWNNDALAWDQVVTKAPGRPNLTEETGVMFAERTDGSAWRTEDMAAHLLERKLVISLGIGGAGFVEWIWNANPYMPLDNEAAIGLLRVAGSAKPELDVVRGVAAFAARAAPWLAGREPDPVMLVVPHSNLLSVRGRAVEATRRAVRAMLYACRTGMDAVSEYNLGDVARPPRLVILPAPGILREEAWRTLLRWMEVGSTLVASGPLDLDEHWLPATRLERLGLVAARRPVARAERLVIAGREHRLSFTGNASIRVETAAPPGGPRVADRAVGKGRLVWCPLPVELAEEAEPTAALYRFALRAAGIEPGFETGADESVLVHAARFRDAVLYSVVSERGDDTDVRLTHRPGGASHVVRLAAGRAALLLVRRSDGSRLAGYNA